MTNIQSNAGDAALLTTIEAAEWLRISPRSLEMMRLRGGGPRYSKVGRAVRYTIGEIKEYIARNSRANTSVAG